MEPKLVRYGRTVNLGNYSTVRLDWEASVDVGETLATATDKLVKVMAEYIKSKGWGE